jgi:hypothetical protein
MSSSTHLETGFEVAILHNIAPCKAYRWKDYDRKTGRINSEGILIFEMIGLHRVFFICHYHVSADWMKVSRSGWHGKVELMILDRGGAHLHKFRLQKFRYCGIAAAWHHDMVFTWNQGEKAYFNTHCTCFEQHSAKRGMSTSNTQKRHYHIKIWEIEDGEWEMPDLFEQANWRWVHKAQSFRAPALPPIPPEPAQASQLQSAGTADDGSSCDGPDGKDVPATTLSFKDWTKLDDVEQWTIILQGEAANTQHVGL